MILNTNEHHWVTESHSLNLQQIMNYVRYSVSVYNDDNVVVFEWINSFCYNHHRQYHQVNKFYCRLIYSFCAALRLSSNKICCTFWRSACFIADFFLYLLLLFLLFSNNKLTHSVIHRTIAVKICFMLIHYYIKLIFFNYSVLRNFNGNLFLLISLVCYFMAQ